MDADAWAAIAAWAGFVATAGAGIYTGSQARTAKRTLVEAKAARQTAVDQAHSARESAASASKSADAAVDQAASARQTLDLARAQSARERIAQARLVHDDAQSATATILAAVAPVEAGHIVIPNISVMKRAKPEVLRLAEVVDRLRDIGLDVVAEHYDRAHRYAQATLGLIREVDSKAGPLGLPPDVVPTFTERYDDVVLAVRTHARDGKRQWAEWRDEQTSRWPEA